MKESKQRIKTRNKKRLEYLNSEKERMKGFFTGQMELSFLKYKLRGDFDYHEVRKPNKSRSEGKQ